MRMLSSLKQRVVGSPTSTNDAGERKLVSLKEPGNVPEYENHPGGQSTLRAARQCTRADLMFLSYHLGKDWKRIEKAC